MSDAQHTVRQLQPAVGTDVSVRMGVFTVNCKVLDAKNSYGRVRILVEPKLGSGQAWVELSRLVEDAQHAIAALAAHPGEWFVNGVLTAECSAYVPSLTRKPGSCDNCGKTREQHKSDTEESGIEEVGGAR